MAGLSNDDLNKLKAELKAQADLQRKLNEDSTFYYQLLKDIKQLHKDIASAKKQEVEQENKALKAAKAYEEEIKKGVNANAKLVEELKEAKDLEELKLKIIKQEITEISKMTAELTKQAKEVSSISTIFSSVKKDVISITKNVKQGYGSLKQWSGVFDIDKSIRQSATQMGLLTKQTQSFRDSLDYAGQQTATFGVGIGELAKLQADYNEELGRSVMLSSKGLEAIAQIAKGTTLGAEGAAKLASDFEQQGISAERTRDFIEQTLNDSTKMGLNASKVIKNIQANIKLLNKYNFKGGVAGLAKMAQSVSKLGVSMEFVSGMAEKLFDIEGAVDMSAQLQVMGGAWAKLADPFKLMYMARNDMAGLVEEIGKAAESSIHFNKQSGQFEISALEMHRLRKIAEQTGVSYEELATAGKNAAKSTQIRSQIKFNIDKETQDFLSNTAKFNNSGEAYIEINGDPKLLKTLTDQNKNLIKSAIQEKASLEERAKASQTFDDSLKNVIMQLKQFLLPFVNALDKGLRPVVDKLGKTLSDPKLMDGLKNAAEVAGKAISVVGDFVSKNPITAFVGAIAGLGLMQTAKWYLNGVSLGMGFNSVANAGGGLGNLGGGMGKGLFGKIGGIGGKGGLFGKFGKTTGGLSLGKSLAKGGKAFTGLGLAGLAMDVGREFLDDRDSNLGKTLGVGGTAAGWAGTGALIGSVIPGIGTLAGGIIGGVAGAGKGLYDEFFSDEAKSKSAAKSAGIHDGIIGGGNFSKGRGIIQGGRITPIDNKDDLLAYKPNGPVDKTLKGGNGLPDTIKIEFGTIKFDMGELRITADGQPGLSLDIMKDPQIIRSLTRLIHSETEKIINGGVNKG